MKSIAFFNNKGGVGKTSLVYHLAWMFSDHGIKVLAVDLDPQANLTAMFLDEDRLETLWPDGEHPDTVLGSIRPILRGIGDIARPHVEKITEHLGLVAGDLGLSRFEDKLSDAWPRCQLSDESAFRTMTAFHRLIQRGAEWGIKWETEAGADLVLVDVGPNLGAINRSALIASDQVCLPLAPDLFSLQGLKNLGPTLSDWRAVWTDLLKKAPPDLPMPKGMMQPMGYIVMQHGILDSRPVKAYKRWMDRIPNVYREVVLNEKIQTSVTVGGDPYCLSLLKHYRSLMPMAMEARKPIFFLKSADGAIGAHIEAVRSCYRDFEKLAARIAANAGLAFD
ncbi:Cobyrinic acid ac-diamide synthase [Candidatus Accumulibacter aalborgensis]|uniref:Cobyrinic acid ac-diamide synthase n=1 Tax=Candidatus Accumulibacter aalborgensis TaxID=1860102 RepID=A0A1A8XLJ3_9PROT|nr:ParA family protein [Candidatus Accumulibacter aalborgensis]SBT06039.1 Cobyrinic acid ac-diamide synthase [Candidatus Accumulibacter aalborgensis]